MHTDVVKAALTGAWVLAVLAFGYMSGTSSFAGWTLLAMVSLVPRTHGAALECAVSDDVGDYPERTSLM